MSDKEFFEEIGLMESDLGGSTNSDRHSSSESSEITMCSSTDPVNTAWLKNLQFELAWKTRDEIICSLNQHTKLLSDLIIKTDVREKTRKANGDLIVALLNLPLKVEDRLRSFDSLGHSPDDGSNDVLLDLGWMARSRIFDTLMTNHNIVLLEADSVSSECKSKLIDQNNDLAYELLKLRTRTVSKGNFSDREGLVEDLGRKFLRWTN